MSRDVTEESGVSNRVTGLVAALRTGRADAGSAGRVRRSPNLESVLPEGHRARLIWDYIVSGAGRDVLALTHTEQMAPGASPQVMLAIWIYAYSKGIGGAKDVIELCRTHPGFRWICGAQALTEQQLIDFRVAATNISDEVLAECLVGLSLSGVLGPRRGSVPVADEPRLLSALDDARRRVQSLRLRVDAPLSGEFQQRALAANDARSERKKRVGSALGVLKRVIDAQGARQHREDELQRQVARSKVTRPLVFVVRPVLGAEPALPWSHKDEDDRRYFRFLGASVGFFILVSLLLILVVPPPIERAEAEKVPQRIAKLVLEKREPPKPEPVKIEEVKPKDVVPEKVEEKLAPEAVPQPKREVAPAKVTTPEVAAARERASRTGLVAMRDQLAALRALSSDSLRQQQVSVGAEGSSQRIDQDLIGAAATGGSGGVAGGNVAYGGGGTLAGHRTTQVKGPSSGPSLAEINKEARSGKRSNEDIKFGFDANKSALDAIYRRALRENPTLEGRVVFRLSVDASGLVTACSIASSELRDPALEAKLVSRVQLINFVARPGVAMWSNTFEIQFVPTS